MALTDTIVHYVIVLLIKIFVNLVYLSFEAEQNVTIFCIISILVLLTHMPKAQLALSYYYLDFVVS